MPRRQGIRPGPKPKPPHEIRNAFTLQIPLNEAEEKAIRTAAKGEPIAVWARAVLLAAAKAKR